MIQIVTDSSTLFTIEEEKALGIDILPLCVTVGDYEGRDTRMDMDLFYKKVVEGNNPISSQPPIGEVMDVYEKYPGVEIELLELGGAFVTQGGPKCVAIQYIEK